MCRRAASLIAKSPIAKRGPARTPGCTSSSASLVLNSAVDGRLEACVRRAVAEEVREDLEEDAGGARVHARQVRLDRARLVCG